MEEAIGINAVLIAEVRKWASKNTRRTPQGKYAGEGTCMSCGEKEWVIYDHGMLYCRQCYCPETNLVEQMLDRAAPSCALGVEDTHTL